MFTLAVCGVIFVAAHVLLFLALRGGRRPFHPASDLIASISAFLLFMTLALTGTRIWAAIQSDPVPSSAERIEVYAHQFAWNFRYPGPDGKFGRTSIARINDAAGNPLGLEPGEDDIVTATLRVPAGREIVLTLHARDVIHDFFVRELRLKQDVVPGMDIPYRFRADRPGVYEIACSELCGLGHSQMRATLEVMEPAAYDEWKRNAR